MFGWWWNYPAKKAGIWLMYMGVLLVALDAIRNSGGWQPDYNLASGLAWVGTGCALLAYHTLKSGEEDTATKKKIVLAGIAVSAPLAVLYILEIVHIL